MLSAKKCVRYSSVTLVPCLAFALWIGSANAMESLVSQTTPETRSEPVEEIEITGRATRIQLKSEIERIEVRMFGLFNELNDVPEFDVRCQAVMITGSRIAERECVPIYMKRARMNAAQKYLFTDLTPPPTDGSVPVGSGVSVDRRGAPEAETQLWFQNNPKHREFNTRFRELASQHPELLSAAQELQAKRLRLEELEKAQRNETGRLLRSDDKDE